MAQWWELTIPAIATLAGAGIGTWFEGRRSERQQEWQAEETRAQRLEQERRENATLYSTERRQAYANFGKAIYDVIAAAYDLQRIHRLQLDGPGSNGPSIQMEEARKQAFSALFAAAQALRAALVPIQLVGSDEQASLGNVIADEAGAVMENIGSDLHRMQELLEQFFSRGRTELLFLMTASPDTDDVVHAPGGTPVPNSGSE